MLGYYYGIIYKKVKYNVVVDALSQSYEDEASFLYISTPIPDWLNHAHQEWLQDPSTSQLIHKIQTDPNPPKDFSWMENTLKYKGRLVLLTTSTLKTPILQELHSSSIAGHFGFQETYACARRSFFHLGMKKDIYHFFSKCDICQYN